MVLRQYESKLNDGTYDPSSGDEKHDWTDTRDIHKLDRQAQPVVWQEPLSLYVPDPPSSEFAYPTVEQSYGSLVDNSTTSSGESLRSDDKKPGPRHRAEQPTESKVRLLASSVLAVLGKR